MKGLKFAQEEKFEKAVKSLEKVRNDDVSIRDYVLYYLALSYRGQKRCDEARRTFAELAEYYPDSRWYPVADLQGSSTEDCPPLEVPRDEPPSLNCEEVEKVRDKADCWFGLREYPKAKKLYLKLDPTPEILAQISRAAARTQDFETAIRANEDLRKKFPKSREARDALRKIAFLQEDSGDYAAAIGTFQRLVSKAKARSERRFYLEWAAWCHFRMEQYDRAVARYDDALNLQETPRSLYWKGRSLDRLGRTLEAERIYRELVANYPGKYYAIRALERLGGRLHGGKTSVSGTMVGWWKRLEGGMKWSRWSTSVEASRGLGRVTELTALGLLEDAAVETRRVRARLGLLLPPDPKRIRRTKEGSFIYEVRAPKAEDEDYRVPYADHLFEEYKKASIDGLDPLLLYAMMRQESRFREKVVSPAGAIGLLQIMPQTGRALAEEAEWEDYRSEWLYDPYTNIELAVRYVKKLSELFKGRWYAVAASYNAGERVVSQWLTQRGDLLEEEFIEEIPYDETRDYVMKVYANWKAYRVIYGLSDASR